jgi:hypothetical protein
MRYFPAAVLALIACLEPASAWAQKLDSSPGSYNFGSVKVGKSSSYSIQLTNPSRVPLTILSKAKLGNAFSYGNFPLPMTLAPWSGVALPVVFTPAATGYTEGTLVLLSNAQNSMVTIGVSGTGVSNTSPQLKASPAALSFGKVNVGSSTTLQATLAATNAPVTLSSAHTTNGEFAIVGLKLPVTIAAGKTLAVTIRFSPTASGAASGKAVFVSNAANSPTMEQLTGTGVTTAGPQLAVSPATLSFGTVKVGSSATQQATLTASNAAVTISSDQSSKSQFSIVGLKLPATIVAGKSLSVTIQFTPSGTGAVSGTATFTSNALNSPTVEQLTGTGAANNNQSQLAVTPATLNFGNVTVGSSATLQATLAASNAAVIIASDQSSSSEFAIMGLKLPVTLAAGKTLSVTVQFTPNASGAASGKLGFISNAVNSPTVEQLTGTGVAQAAHSVDLSWNAGDGNAVGYNIYRGTAKAGPFQQINTALDSSTNYVDSNVVSGKTYFYVATEIDAHGDESAYSNVTQAVIPNP